MTKKEILTAYENTLLLWKDLGKNGYMDKSESIHYDKVKEYISSCGLCFIHNADCDKCCLGDCWERNTWFQKWVFAKTKDTRKKYALLIANKIDMAFKKFKHIRLEGGVGVRFGHLLSVPDLLSKKGS